MADKYIALAEETSGYGTHVTLNDRIFLKILNESVHVTRGDHFPETAEYWTPTAYAEGPYAAGGDIEILVDPYQFPKLLAFHLGDPSSSGLVANTVYRHVFTYGANESVSATGLKSFTIVKGVGIEKDRRIDGGIITNLQVEARAKEVVGATISVIGNGAETLVTASSPSYVRYSGQRYMTFADANTMTVGGTDRLTTAPIIEAFALSLPCNYDADHYVLGKKTLADQTPSGIKIPTGSMDFTFTSEDEHERFLSIVGATTTGIQSGHVTVLKLRGDTISSGYYNEIEFSIPKTLYTASENAVRGRDRIVHTVNYRGNYNELSGHAVQITVINTTSSYTALANSL
jgi:hypothetical protein